MPPDPSNILMLYGLIGTLVTALVGLAGYVYRDTAKARDIAIDREGETLQAIVKTQEQLVPAVLALADGQKQIVAYVTKQETIAQLQRGGPPP